MSTTMAPCLADRVQAGCGLARVLASSGSRATAVFGLARGGVPVAAVVARALAVPLGVIHALRIPVPGEPERALGAVTAGAHYFNRALIKELDISEEYLQVAARELQIELTERERALCLNGPTELAGTVIIVDDGIASGATMNAAALNARARGANNVVAAAPVATQAGLEGLRFVDQVVVPLVFGGLSSIGAAYADFTQMSDVDVKRVLLRVKRVSRRDHASGSRDLPPPRG